MIGTVVHDQYRIIELLGEGGMGVVYRAVDPLLDREVALKFLKAELGDNQVLLKRFRDELRTLAGFNHANITMLYTSFNWQSRPVMVMELVEGEALNHMVDRRGPIPAGVSVPLICQALAGVTAAHRRGVIHRDLKPANLMLSKDGVLKVMDFGIAKIEDNPGLTRTSSAMGTPFYMAPEQIDPERFGLTTVDARADIYSLGVTLYELLAGQVPFTGPTEFAVHRAHLEKLPEPPTIHYPHIPEPIVKAVLRAMAKDPRDRFQTAEEFAKALQAPGALEAPPPIQVKQPGPEKTSLDGSPYQAAFEGESGSGSAIHPDHGGSVQSQPFPDPLRDTNGREPQGWWARLRQNPLFLAGSITFAALILLGGGLGIATWLSPSPKTEPPPKMETQTASGGNDSSSPLFPPKQTTSEPPQLTPSIPTQKAPPTTGKTSSTQTETSSNSPIAGRWAGSFQHCEDDSRVPATLVLSESSGNVTGSLHLRSSSGSEASCDLSGALRGKSLEFTVGSCSQRGLPVFVGSRYRSLLQLDQHELTGNIEPQNPCILESFRKM